MTTKPASRLQKRIEDSLELVSAALEAESEGEG